MQAGEGVKDNGSNIHEDKLGCMTPLVDFCFRLLFPNPAVLTWQVHYLWQALPLRICCEVAVVGPVVQYVACCSLLAE